MESERCVRVRVSGQVQGVGFRAETRSMADRHGITGKAVNLPDGQVEVTACGEEDAISKLVAWLHQGPSAATVDDVTVEEITIPAPRNFTTG